MHAEMVWTLSVVGAFVAAVAMVIVRESSEKTPSPATQCPQCQHEYSEPETGNTLSRSVVGLPARPARCADLSKEWEATALGSQDCACEHPFHTTPATDWYGLTA